MAVPSNSALFKGLFPPSDTEQIGTQLLPFLLSDVLNGTKIVNMRFRLVYIGEHKLYISVFYNLIFSHTYDIVLSSTCEMTLIDTFQYTPHLPSKGAVGSGNTSRIRVIRPESYCTVQY